jgi:phage-related protein
MERKKVIRARFFALESGSEPVREWLKQEISLEERRLIGADIATCEYRWPVGPPTCKGLGNGLFEVRTDLPGKIARVFFCIDDGVMYLLLGIIKKAQKAPQAALDIARVRLAVVMEQARARQKARAREKK